MKNFFILLWRCIVALFWFLSLLAIIQASFKPGFMSFPSAEPSYPWFGVILISSVVTIECILLYLMLRPEKYAWSPLRVGIAFAVFCGFSIGAAITLLTVDLPAYVYVPSEFTILVTFFLLVLLIITAAISLGIRISKGTSVT